MRFLNRILGITIFFTLLVNNAFGYLAVVNLNGSPTPTLYYFSGESVDDIYTRSGVRITAKYIAWKDCFDSNAIPRSPDESDKYRVYYKNTYYTVNRVVRVGFSESSGYANIRDLNSEARVADSGGNHPSIFFGTGEYGLRAYRAYFANMAYPNSSCNTLSMYANHVVLPKKFTRPICRDRYYEYVDSENKHLLGVECEVGEGQEKATVEEIATFLSQTWSLVWSPVGADPTSVGLEAQVVTYEVVASGENYGNSRRSLVSIKVPASELNKIVNGVAKNSAFVIYGLVNLNNGKTAIDNIFLGRKNYAVYWFYTHENADNFTTVGVWAGDRLYSSDFMLTYSLEVADKTGYETSGYSSFSSVTNNTIALSSLSNDPENYVEFLDPYTGSVLGSHSFKEFDTGKVVGTPFSNIQVPAANYSLYGGYFLEDAFITTTSRNRAAQILLEKKYKAYANFNVKNKQGVVLSSGTINVNDFLFVPYENTVIEPGNFGSLSLEWDDSKSGRTLQFNAKGPGTADGDRLDASIVCAFDFHLFSEKYELMWDILRNGTRLDIEAKYGISYRSSHVDTRIPLFEQYFYSGGEDGSTLNLGETKEFSGATLMLKVFRKTVGSDASKNSEYLQQCDKYMSLIQELSDITATFESIDFSNPSLFKSGTVEKDAFGVESVTDWTQFDFTVNSGKVYNMLGEDISEQLRNPYGYLRSTNEMSLDIDWNNKKIDGYYYDSDGNENTYTSELHYTNRYQDFVYYRSFVETVYYGEPGSGYEYVQPSGDKRWGYSKYSGYSEVAEKYVDNVPTPLKNLDDIDETQPGESIAKLQAATDYGISHDMIMFGVCGVTYTNLGIVVVEPCTIHNGCLAKFFIASQLKDIGCFNGMLSMEKLKKEMLEEWDIENGQLTFYNAGFNPFTRLSYGDTNSPQVKYFIGCQKAGCAVTDNADWSTLRSVGNVSQSIEPFKVEFSWAIPEFTINKRLFGSVGFADNYAGWVFEKDNPETFLYENLTISGKSYMLGSVKGSDYCPKGGSISSRFYQYIMNFTYKQVPGQGWFYDEALRDIVTSDRDTFAGTHKPPTMYAYLGPLQCASELVLEQFINREDSILELKYVDRSTLTNMGFWNVKSEGFKKTGLWSLALGTAWSPYQFHVYVPLYVNGFKRNIYLSEDLENHPNLIAVTNSNSTAPDTYEVASQELGEYSLTDMLVFPTNFYHSGVYKVRWLAHYVDDSGNAHTVTMKKAQELFGIKYSEGSLSKLIKLKLDCSELFSDVDIQKIKFQPIIYKTTQAYCRDDNGNGFEIWEVDDSDPYWVPSNTNVKVAGSDEHRNATVIASVGNFWGVTIKSTTTVKTKDMVVWDFVRNPATYSKSAKWFIGKIDSKLSNATVSATGWGTSNCTYSIKKANGSEAYTGKVSFLSPTGNSTGNLNENTYGWTFNQEIPDYLASDLKVFYMDEPVGGKATFKVDPNNKKKILLQGLQDSQFRTASAAIIAKLTTAGYESITGVWTGAPIPYTTNLGAPLYPAGEEALFDAQNYKNGWSVPVKLSGIFRWDGDSAPTDGSTVKDSTGNTVTPGSKLTPGEYTVIKDGEEHTMYVNGVTRKNERNVYLKSGDNTPKLAFTFKYPVQLNSDGTFIWYGIQGEFGLKNPVSSAFTPFKDAYNGMKAPWNTYFTGKGSCTGFTDSATEASYVLKGAKADVDGMEFGAKVGGEFSESYSIFVQPDAVIQVKLEKVE